MLITLLIGVDLKSMFTSDIISIQFLWVVKTGWVGSYFYSIITWYAYIKKKKEKLQHLKLINLKECNW